MKTLNLKKETIINIFSDMSTEELNKVYSLINLFSNTFLSKRDIMKFLEIDKSGKVDSAIPLNYVREIEKILPGFNTMFNVYDYRQETFGEMRNIAELFILEMHKEFNQ